MTRKSLICDGCRPVEYATAALIASDCSDVGASSLVVSATDTAMLVVLDTVGDAGANAGANAAGNAVGVGDAVGDVVGVQYVILGGGDEYERINDIKNTQATVILPLNFPKAFNVEDSFLTTYLELEQQYKTWVFGF